MRSPRRRSRVAATALLVLVAGCGSGDGLADALEVDTFSSCLADAGADTGAADGTTDQQLAFWAEPGTLECALGELEDEQLPDALSGAFEETEPGSAEQGEQRQVLADWARRCAAQQGLRPTLDEAERLLRSTWVADGEVTETNSLAGALVAGAMRGSGDLQSWEAVAPTDPTSAESATAQIRWIAGGPAPDGSGPTDEEYRTFYDLRDDLVDAVRR